MKALAATVVACAAAGPALAQPAHDHSQHAPPPAAAAPQRPLKIE